MTIVKHRAIHEGVFAGVLMVIVCGSSFYFVDGSEISLRWARPIFDPIMGFGFVYFSYVLLAMIRSRGRLLVGGDDWIAEYRLYRPFPISKRVTVKKTKGMVLRSEPLRARLQRKGFEEWVDLVVIQNGREVIRVPANPKWLEDNYQETFDDWKRADRADPAVVPDTGAE